VPAHSRPGNHFPLVPLLEVIDPHSLMCWVDLADLINLGEVAAEEADLLPNWRIGLLGLNEWI
jgi:hypothetical protein